jgi:hypothetical protein
MRCARSGSSPLPVREHEPFGENAEAYCEYRSHKAFPFSISALAIVTYSVSEHSLDHLFSFYSQIDRARICARPHHLAYAFSPSLICATTLLLGSIQTIANMFTYVLWTFAYCMSRWRSN